MSPSSSSVEPSPGAEVELAKKQVVYLFGAGASHGAVKARKSTHGILMRHISQELAEAIRTVVFRAPFAGDISLRNLVNNVVDEETDFEHIITFLDQSPSAIHRAFAGELRVTFQSVLRRRLEAVGEELGGAQSDLYLALLDMYEVPGIAESLKGLITLNYDEFLEEAVERLGDRRVDFGISISEEDSDMESVEILKLHGSFGWEDIWPIRRSGSDRPLWIPPGIRKAKESYPFNMLWGRAREMLDCDVLRIIGCRLGPNDWDLVSLLFSTRHVNSSGQPYQILVIDHPRQAERVQEQFPYLEVLSILEVEPIGSHLISEILGGEPRKFHDLDRADQAQVVSRAGSRNWFLLWLNHMAEAIYRDNGTVDTTIGAFGKILEDYA